MFIDSAAKYQGTEGLRCVETVDYKIYWLGFVYSRGIAAGRACIDRLATDLQNHSLEYLAATLWGAYLILVHNKRTDHCYVLVDNSGLFHAFYSDNGVSTSFLELAAFKGLRASDMDPATVAEFIHFGYISFDRTLFREIHKLPPEYIVCISPKGGISFLPKILVSFDSPTVYSLEDILHDFTLSVSAEKVSVDLTGGLDTRFSLFCFAISA